MTGLRFVFLGGLVGLLAACGAHRGPTEPLELGSGTERADGTNATYQSQATEVQTDAPQGFVKRGSGDRIASRLPSATRWQADGAGLKLNFQNADIAAVADAVLGEALGLTYSIDPSIDGRITLQTNEAVPREAVLFALESALQPVGVSLVDEGGFYKLMPALDRTRDGTTPVVGLSAKQLRAGYGVHVVPLSFTSAERVAELITPFVPARAKITVDPQRNLLMIAGTGPERLSLVDMVSVFDVDWMSGLTYGLVPLRAAEASALVRELDTVFSSASDGLASDVIRFVPVERLNAILVIAANADLLVRAEEWVEQLDTGGENAGNRLYIYKVQNGRARDLAAVLGGLFGAQQQVQSFAGAGGVAPGQRAAVMNAPMPGRGGAPLGGGAGQGASAFGAGQTARDANTISAGTPRVSQSEPLVSFANERMRIIADERNNALLVLATPGDYQLVRNSIRQLDVEPLQVLIDAAVIEVGLNDDLEYGVQWFFESGDFNFTNTSGTSNTITPSAPGFSGIFNSGDVNIIVDALDSVTDIEILSSPQLMVMNNQTATLQVGDEVPVPQGTALNLQGDSDTLFNTITFRSTGVILQVTPRVNANGMVLLDIEQEVSSVVETESSGIDAPTIQQRRISSTVAVRSGETLALGGLIQSSTTIIDSGVPVLKNIPLLGNAFKNRDERRQRTELLILVTPRVVGSVEEARSVTEELRRRMRGLEPLIKPRAAGGPESGDLDDRNR
ncbi:type II secretion system secretin GspD [Eilatimonas milleporae]|uniref:Type II secretion system protein D (GspD) n=1 Tax=Eilatimonas milleporae TaxID=911205 RepID=A0A3M0CFH5_9PROT|nr:type II secretion system secretin GspD [Eilatimonas milleporae]RMB08162.1 type II secretion system protein D (GspD) [Eilatimonas milleporae]